MKLIVDANIIIAILLMQGKTAKLFLSDKLELFSPPFLIQEIEKHATEILSKTKRTRSEFNKVLTIIHERITFLNEEDVGVHMQMSTKMSPDFNDSAYFAAALFVQCPIWSEDKQLKKQKIIKIYTTNELIEFHTHLHNI